MNDNTATAGTPIRILVVDDIAAVREPLLQVLRCDADLELAGWAADVDTAQQLVQSLAPDVVLLNGELARVDTLPWLRRLLRQRPVPVLVSAAATPRSAALAFGALEQGAVDLVVRPRPELPAEQERYAGDCRRQIRMAAGARVRPLGASVSLRGASPVIAHTGQPGLNDTGLMPFRGTDQLIALGAGEGGVAAVRDILCRLPAETPAMVIALSLPKVFSTAFAQRMNDASPLIVHEARDGQTIQMGHVYFAPGNQHLQVEREAKRYRCRLSDAHPVHHRRPSVDVLFHSVAHGAGARAIGVILTGAGTDGAMGLKALRERGAATLVQDERSSVVWGMPGAAIQTGAAGQILPLEQMADGLQQLVAQRRDAVAARA